MTENGPVTIREVYTMSEKILSEVRAVDGKLTEFKGFCAEKSGALSGRVTVLEERAGNSKYVGRENRSYIFNAMMLVLSALIGALTYALIG